MRTHGRAAVGLHLPCVGMDEVDIAARRDRVDGLGDGPSHLDGDHLGLIRLERADTAHLLLVYGRERALNLGRRRDLGGGPVAKGLSPRPSPRGCRPTPWECRAAQSRRVRPPPEEASQQLGSGPAHAEGG